MLNKVSSIVRSRIKSYRSMLGGIKALNTNDLFIAKQKVILENRKVKVLGEFNKAQAYAQTIKQQINNLREEAAMENSK